MTSTRKATTRLPRYNRPGTRIPFEEIVQGLTEDGMDPGSVPIAARLLQGVGAGSLEARAEEAERNERAASESLRVARICRQMFCHDPAGERGGLGPGCGGVMLDVRRAVLVELGGDDGASMVVCGHCWARARAGLVKILTERWPQARVTGPYGQTLLSPVRLPGDPEIWPMVYQAAKDEVPEEERTPTPPTSAELEEAGQIRLL